MSKRIDETGQSFAGHRRSHLSDGPGGRRADLPGRPCGPPPVMRRPTPCATTTAVPATAAVRATGPPMTPRRPLRPGPSGMSVSFFVGLERGEDCLDRDAAVGDELAARAACRGGERAAHVFSHTRTRPSCPAPSPRPDRRRRPSPAGRPAGSLPRGARRRPRGLRSPVASISPFSSFTRTIRSRTGSCRRRRVGELRGHLAGEVGDAWWELDHQVVDRSQFVQILRSCFLPSCRVLCQFFAGRAMM